MESHGCPVGPSPKPDSRGLPEDLDLTNQCVLLFVVIVKLLPANTRHIALDTSRRVQHVPEVREFTPSHQTESRPTLGWAHADRGLVLA